MITLTGLLGVCDPDHTLPDHSLLTWSYHHGDNDYNDNDRLSIEPMTLPRYDVTDIPRDFMYGDVSIECCSEITANSDDLTRE